MIATTWSEMIALKAALEPMLMRDMRQVKMQVKAIAFAGISILGCTCPIHLEKGRPLSRAKAKV